MMRRVAVVSMIAIALSLTLPAWAFRPWGRDVAGRNPDVVWERIRENPQVQRVRNILSRHRTWERNNVLRAGRYVNDRAVLQVEPEQFAFRCQTLVPGTIHTPLADAKWIFLWRYADVDASWGRGDFGGVGSVIVEQGERQWRFPIYVGPGGRFHEVRLVTYKGKTLLYLMQPATDRYLEEWILK